ncbi:conserved hypothetical protein [Beutenbergia cavernae DSM 12333]|uniref:Uncharacterized protein n=1 Tax=Beutenbergia cavernae (strain ATCC BAA-8 / DSM 12333 / CCUG 43141 / JCM 11478 / NBRC 16432 / NCIMB 13614 / HKI 0122) TaxID=471853 RepID=C5BVT8_BEUC1|nr:hypothetical protein [Beutenbergia cavernae]ACQ78528.1 conserved hypothetical protein [Beutenbergia cavernae DSM 12333]
MTTTRPDDVPESDYAEELAARQPGVDDPEVTASGEEPGEEWDADPVDVVEQKAEVDLGDDAPEEPA